jgi:hypothetical protein
MKITYKNLILLALNTSCAITNAYFAPTSFIASFAIGVITGLGMGLKCRLQLVKVSLNQKAIEKLKKVAAPAQDLLPPPNVNPYANKVASIVKPLFEGILTLSGYRYFYQTAQNLIGGFDEQRQAIVDELNPIPGIALTAISIGALATNLGYIQQPILSKITLLSGLPAGIAVGTWIMRNFNFPNLQDDAYTAACEQAV